MVKRQKKEKRRREGREREGEGRKGGEKEGKGGEKEGKRKKERERRRCLGKLALERHLCQHSYFVDSEKSERGEGGY